MRNPLPPLLAALLAAGPAFGAGPGVRVDVSTVYRAQWAQRDAGDDESDQDLSVGLGVEVDEVGLPGLGFSGLLHYDADVDGTSESSLYKDNLDTYSRRDDWRLYRAVVSYDLPAGWARVEAGRQEVWSAETVLFDGGLVRLAPCRWARLEAFGGRRVSFYEDPEPDAVYGGNLDLRPRPGTLFRLEEVHYIRNSFEARWVQDLMGWGTGRVSYRMIGGDPQEVSAALHAYPWPEAEVHLGWVRTLAQSGDDRFAYDYTSFGDYEVPYLTFEPLEPYAEYSVTARQGFSGTAGLGVRLRHHNVIEKGDEDTYNVDFDEGALLFDLSDFPWSGFRLDAEAVRWVEDRDRSDLTEDNRWGVSVALEQSWRGHGVGAAFQRQTYDSDGRPRDARCAEVWVRLALWNRADLHLRYARERDDLYRADGVDALNTLTARLNLTF
ncbi:MAG: hypothetical protein Kow0092_02270 [Deferrisomatales bacterium]